MKIFIVSGRTGTEIAEPRVFYDRINAKEYVTDIIYELLLDNERDELIKNDVDPDDKKAVLEWGEENDYVSDYNDSGFTDTYMAGSDWTENMITEMEVSPPVTVQPGKAEDEQERIKKLLFNSLSLLVDETLEQYDNTEDWYEMITKELDCSKEEIKKYGGLML